MSEAKRTPADRLRAALRAAALPSAVRQAWTDRPPTPAPGQIWRARWATVTQLLLVVDAPSHAVRTVPITLEVDAADDSAAVLPPGHSTLTVPLVVWLDDAVTLPLRVLDRFLGSLSVDLAVLPAADRGRPVLTPTDERRVQHARLQDLLDVLVAARWAPQGDGNLRALLSAMDQRSLGQVLDVPDRTVISLLRGQVPLAPDQASRLAPLVHQPVDALLAANPRLPEDLVADLDRPVYRAKVVELARRHGADEIDMWQKVGYAVASVAHRQTEGDAPSWSDRLDRYFALVLDEQ